jgi:hypothetical protein
MYLFSEINFIPLILLLALWTLGGWLITARVFDLSARERGLISLAVGLTLGTWFANWLARFTPTAFAFWGAALLTVVIGVVLAWPLKRDLFPKEAFQPGQWLLFFAFVIIFTLIGRGLGIFDDYQNLPQLSSMALGDIPPHFAFDPRVLWSYHYFLLILAAQFERLAGAAPWAALDLARGLTLALALAFGGMLAQRLTGNRIVAALSVAFMFFVGGARWILLLLPARLLNAASASVTLIGSGADTAPNLTAALTNYWQIQGLGPLPFPFVYGSGLDASLVLSHAGYGASMVMLALLLVLLAGKGRGWIAQALFAILLGALALVNEVTFVFLYAGLVCAALLWVVKNRTLRLPPSLWSQLPAFVGGGLLALVQGGVFTGVVAGWVGRLTGAPTEALYKVSFAFRLPAVLSAHLGSLSLFNPVDWFVILAETGLVVLALPWALKYAFELARDEKWIEAAWLFSIVPSLLTIFVEYTGNAGPTALSRMTAHFLLVLKIYAVPLLWLWAQKRSETLKITLLGWGLAACLSGLALFSLEMAAMPNPVYGESLSALDARMYEKYWGALDPNALVFDPNPIRGTIVLGLHTISSNNYGPPSDPTFVALANDPDPSRLNAAGYRYVYLDLQYWRKYASRFEQACVRSLDKFEDTGADGKPSDLRWLVDVSGCR